MTMKLNDAGKNIIKTYEGCKLSAYICPAGKITIGYGNTFYEDGSPVKLKDRISQVKANDLFNIVVNSFEIDVLKLIKVPINENQFSALVSFAYNTGISNFKKSTLLKLVNKNPQDENIKSEFMKWVNSNGKKLKGLENRRKAEIALYYKK